MGIFVALALVPGALAHHCTGGDTPDSSSDQLSAQAFSPTVSPLALAAYALIPIVGLLLAIAIAIPSMKKTKPAQGAWQFTGTAYVWVPEKK